MYYIAIATALGPTTALLRWLKANVFEQVKSHTRERPPAHGAKLNAQNFILSHTDDTLIKTINQALLQFISAMNLADLLPLHFSPSVSSMTQTSLCGYSCENMKF